MPTDLEHVIATTPLVDTHEHLFSEERYVKEGPDVLQDLLDNYVGADLVVAGAAPEAVKKATWVKSAGLAARWEAIANAWQHCRHTGYGEAVRLIAKEAYGMDEITVAGLEAAQEINTRLRQPGQRLHIMKERGNLHSTQIDAFVWSCPPDASGRDFFLYDLNVMALYNGSFNAGRLGADVNLDITTPDTLRQAIAVLFDQNPHAIATKSQHAYARTLAWKERSDDEIAPLLEKLRGLPEGKSLPYAERIVLGDWCAARCVEQAIAHDLPIKIHTGYYAGHGRLEPDYIRAGQLCPLLQKYPAGRFVLMHTAYPYSDELIAIAKQFPQVYVDLCWAWAINPAATLDCVRKLIHAVPANKVFAFGGDTGWPNAAVAYATQARTWLGRALAAEVSDGLLTETEAAALARAWMSDNQHACFRLDPERDALARTAG